MFLWVSTILISCIKHQLGITILILKEHASKNKFCLVSNGSKEQIGQTTEGATASEEFEPWRGQQQNSAAHTGYGASVPISNATDIYNMGSAGI